jgi:hypothetical protein
LERQGIGEAAAMTAVQRRRAPRYPADWSARYRFDAPTDWRECRIIDVSAHGAAVELSWVDPDDDLVGWFHLEVSSASGDEAGISVRSQIRHRARLEGGRVIVGVEFFGLRDEQVNLLRLLVGLRTAR